MGKRRVFLILGLVLFGFSVAWAQKPEKRVRIVYPKKTRLDFSGLNIEGELKNPGEFYFQHRSQEKFDSLLDRRKNFHREMLRDVVMSR